MTFKQFKQNKFVRFFTNRYIIILIVFTIWMLFFDENSYIVHREFNKEIDNLKIEIDSFKKKLKKDKKTIESIKDSLGIEKFAREQYLMKKKNEDIYIIEFDTIKK